jgi:hypothetical protein
MGKAYRMNGLEVTNDNTKLGADPEGILQLLQGLKWKRGLYLSLVLKT